MNLCFKYEDYKLNLFFVQTGYLTVKEQFLFFNKFFYFNSTYHLNRWATTSAA